jgi:uncharacterized membrane protein
VEQLPPPAAAVRREIGMRWLRRLGRYFVAGVLAILPLVITVGVVMWVADFFNRALGPDTAVGHFVSSLGVRFVPESHTGYVTGLILVAGAILALGFFVEAGARNFLQRCQDRLLGRIPLIGSIYGTSRQILTLLDQKDPEKVKGMRAVFVHFGGAGGCGVLALQVSPEEFILGGRSYRIVIIPTAPVPVGGGLLFIPAELIQPTELSVDKLMSVYVSMGVTAPQFLKT